MIRRFPAVSVLALLGALAYGQSFNSGSNGSDGALNLTTPGTVIFDPRTFNPPLDPDGDNVYHFTTINIAAGVTVKLKGNVINGPVFWLAQGQVTISGIIDLDGENGHPATGVPAIRAPSVPGAGGYAGGVGSLGSLPAQPGLGPGGGTGLNACGRAGDGTFTGTPFLVPLVGGSGGAGNGPSAFGSDGGGGAGGGALLVASSTAITVNGQINARGGATGSNDGGGAGSGGAIRLAAPTISGSGFLQPQGVATCTTKHGVVRLEALQQNFTGGVTGTLSLASPFNVFLPVPTSVRVISVAGVPVPPSPTGSFTVPDVSINSAAAVSFAIEANNIPLGTVVKLQIFSENLTDQTVDASPLQGTLQLSTATASIILPSGFSRGFVRATWIQ